MSKFSTLLLQHFDKHGRKLPWREKTCAETFPYRVWLSEIMLQQTTVATVIPYYQKFLEIYPTVQSLAEGELDDILHLWQGLGYYSRARNLHKCANVVVNEYNGKFPTTEKELLNLPGIGPYTAAAIASIAMNEVATVVDGNVERVISRLYKIETPLPKAKAEIKEYALKLNDKKRPSDYSGAIMDLGATICTPKSPKCMLCPVISLCAAHKDGCQTDYPKKEPKKKRPEKTGTAWCLFNEYGEIYLERRPETGLLAKLWQTPNAGWDKQDSNIEHLLANAHTQKAGRIRHVFTHFGLELDVMCAKVKKDNSSNWYSLEKLPALPTLMKKVINEALQADSK